MFPVRYFAPRYFAPRYWPNLGAEIVEEEEVDVGSGGPDWASVEHERLRARHQRHINRPDREPAEAEPAPIAARDANESREIPSNPEETQTIPGTVPADVSAEVAAAQAALEAQTARIQAERERQRRRRIAVALVLAADAA